MQFKVISSLCTLGLFLITSAAALAQTPTQLANLQIIDASSGKTVQSFADFNIDPITITTDLKKPLGIVANLTKNVPSVYFNLNGPVSYSNVEAILPYSLFGNDPQDLNKNLGKILQPGIYTLKISTCSQIRAQCNNLLKTIKLNVVSSNTPRDLGFVTRLEAIQVNTNPNPYVKLEDLTPDSSGNMTLNIKQGIYPNFLARFSVDHPSGVKFDIQQIDGKGLYSVSRIAHSAPLAVFGNSGGTLFPWRKIRAGTFKIVVSECATMSDSLCLNKIQDLYLHISIFDLPGPLSPTPTATSTGTAIPTATATAKPTKTAVITATATPKPSITATRQPTTTVIPKPSVTITPTPSATPTPKPIVTSNPIPGSASAGELKKAAIAAGMYVGFAVQSHDLDDKNFRDTLIREANIITPENECKPNKVLTQIYPRTWNLDPCKKIVQFAHDNGMALRFHFFFGNAGAEVLPGAKGEIHNIPVTDTVSFMKEYIDVLTKMVREVNPNGLVQYDVVNEQIDSNNGQPILKKSVWDLRLGDGWIANAFKWVRQADPKGVLVWNDFRMFDELCAVTKDLKNSGVPIDAVGLQAHGAQYGPGLDKALSCFASAGLQTLFTERDNGIVMPINNIKVAKQAADFALTASMCKNPKYSCDTHVFWALSDGKSWNNTCKRAGANSITCKGAPVLFDDNYKKKPYRTATGTSSAYDDVVQALMR